MQNTAVVQLLIVIVTFLVGSCSTTQTTTYPAEDTLTPGIFLEVEERAVLPEGVELRRVYNKGIQSTKVSEGWRGRLYHDVALYCSIGYGHL